MSRTIDIHALQAVPPSCLNRDQSNSPKTAIYGGERRMRVSSQSWKRAMRDYSISRFDKDDYGTRTLNVVPMIAERLAALGKADTVADAVPVVKKALADAGVLFKYAKVKGKGKKTEESDQLDALFFIGNRQLDAVAADIAKDDAEFEGDDKAKARGKAIRHDISSGHSIDLALYGRMLAHQPELDLEAAAEVAHAIGVSPVQTEFDYFSAIDDHSLENHSGGAMIGDIEYDSGVLYRYASLSMPILERNLENNEDMERKAVREFVDSFIQSMPTGRQKSFAAETLPDTVIVEVHEGRPRSLAGAFEDPVTPERGIMTAARERLGGYLRRVDEAYGFDGSRLILSLSEGLDVDATPADTLAQLEDEVTKAALAEDDNRRDGQAS